VFGRFSVLVHLGFFFVAVAGIVLADLIDGFLIGVDFLEQLLQVRQLHLGFPGEIENAFTDHGIQGDLGNLDQKRFIAATKPEFVGELDARLRAVVVVRDFLGLASEWKRFLEKQMRLRVEEELMFDAGLDVSSM